MERRTTGWVLLILGCLVVISVVPFPFGILLCLAFAGIGYYCGSRLRDGDRK